MFIVPVTRDARPYARSGANLHVSPWARLLDETLDRHFSAPANETAAARSPALDVAEGETTYTVKLDMPGVSKEEVKVAIEGRQVSVQAQGAQSATCSEGERVVHRERAALRYARSFSLATEVDASAAAAKLENGVLTLTLPKRGAHSAAQLTVN